MSEAINNNAEMAALMAEMKAMREMLEQVQAEKAAAEAALIAAQTRKTRQAKPPVDRWSNAQLMVYGNDHSRVIAALALLLRSGKKESEITQQELTRATLALQFVLKGWRENGRCAMAEASIRTAVGQARLWRELVNAEKLVENCKRIQLDDFGQRVFNFYCQYSFWPGEKEDSNKRLSPMAAALLMEEWRKRTAENPDWLPPGYTGTVEETPETSDGGEA